MNDNLISPERNIINIIKNATSVQNGADIYCNHAQISLSINEMTIDLYLLLSKIGSSDEVIATHIQRVIIPLNMAKGLAGAITEMINNFEKETGIKLIDSRFPISQ